MQKTINHRQLVFLTFITIITVSIMTISKTQALNTGHSAWIPILITGLIFGIMSVIFIKLNKTFEGDTLFEYSTKIVGKFFAIVIALFFVMYFLVFSSYFCVTFFQLIRANFLPKTPEWAALLVSMPFLGLIAYKGMISAGRLAELVGLLFFVVTLIILITMFFQGNMSYILPLYEKVEAKHIFKGVFATLDQFIGISIISLVPISKSDKRIGKVMFFTIMGMALLYLLNVYGCYAMIGVDETKQYNYPLMDAIRLVEYKRIEFFQRLDVTYQTIGFIRVIAAKGFIYLCALEYLCKIFKRVKRIILVVVLGIVIYIVDVILLGITNITDILFTVRTFFGIVASFLIPITLLIIAKVKNIEKKAN